MKNIHPVSQIWKTAILVLAIAAGGCEDNADDYQYNVDPGVSALKISPASATLNAEESWMIFCAVGGTAPYHWSIRDESIGKLDTNIAITVVYNRISAAKGANIIHLKDANNWTSEALIQHTTNVSGGITSVTGIVTSY